MSKQANKRMRRFLRLKVNRQPLPNHQEGYPVYYLMSDGGCLCADCVNDEIDQIDESTRSEARDGWQMVGTDCNWEDADMLCDHCGDPIPCAYPPDPEPDPRLLPASERPTHEESEYE